MSKVWFGEKEIFLVVRDTNAGYAALPIFGDKVAAPTSYNLKRKLQSGMDQLFK